MTKLFAIAMGVVLAASSTCMGMSSPLSRRDVGGSCSSDYDYISLSCPVSSNGCLEGFNANAFYQNGECNCVCIRDGRREAHNTAPESIPAQKATKALPVSSRRDAGGSCSSDYNYFGFDCPVDSDNCDAGYHANAFYQNGICNCVCMQNGRREAHTAPQSSSAQEELNVLPATSRRDAGGSCSSDYNYFGFDCPVDSDNCDAGYHANAFYQNGICNCVCMQNGRREAHTAPQSSSAQEESNVLPATSRRDAGGSCSSDYNYFGFDCPVDSDNCDAGYHANAFYQNGVCNCVCMQNGRREAHTAPQSNPAQEAMDGLAPRSRRNAGGSCSSDYNYFGFNCPVDSDNCAGGYHASAHYDYDHSECNCVCLSNGRREASTPSNVADKVTTVRTETRRDTGGSCSSDYNYFGFDCPVDSDNCAEGYHASANYDYDHSECNCECVQN